MAGKSYHKNYNFVCAFLATFLVFSMGTLITFNILYDVQPKPYLDEVFHIPQAIKYCNGSFIEWDPKITTLPGLYLLSIGTLKPISWILQAELCTVYGLRFINLLCCIANFIIIFNIRNKMCKHEEKHQWKILFGSFNMAIFPVLYFFTFLYYTDSLSTLLILLMYALYIDQSYYLSALLGCIAVICRQTNIVWITFFALKTGLDSLQNHLLKINKKNAVAVNWKDILASVIRTPKIHIPFIKDLVKKEAGFIFTIVLFLLFVWINKGIVVGDRLAHQAIINIPQLFYFCLFVSVFCSPFAVTFVKKFVIFIYEHTNSTLGILLFFSAVVALNTHVHPYLLADNRHYTFYLWKRLFERNWAMRYLLTPEYLFGAFCIHNFISHKKYSFQIAFYLCLIVSLIPQKLLEFRYFILPFLIMRINMKLETWWQLIFEFCLFLFINVSTIQLFITKTFYWKDSEDIQRIMW